MKTIDVYIQAPYNSDLLIYSETVILEEEIDDFVAL